MDFTPQVFLRYCLRTVDTVPMNLLSVCESGDPYAKLLFDKGAIGVFLNRVRGSQCQSRGVGSCWRGEVGKMGKRGEVNA